MIVYILDVIDMQPESTMTEEESLRAEIIWMNRDLFRGCTTNRGTVQIYYNSLISLIGKYVTMEVYEYQSETSYDKRGEDPPDDVLTTLAMTLYNMEAPGGRNIKSLSVLISYPFGNDDDEMFIIPDAINDVYIDSELAAVMPELDTLNTVALLFTKLGDYIPELDDNPDIVALKRTMFEIIPALVYDFYDLGARYSMCPVRLEMNWFRSLKFIL